MEPYVNLNVENGVGFIEFFHPNKNAMPSEVLVKLTDTINNAACDETIKILVLKSGGDRTFCAGASFNELITIEDEATGKQFFSGFANVINAMRKCPKLIIGRIQGKSVGGGVGLAAATDYCLATKYAAIRLSELSIGIGPFVIEPAVSRKIGKMAMAQMAIDSETFFSWEFAKQHGLYANVYDTIEALDEAVKVLAEKLASYNPDALVEMKSVIWKGTEDWDTLLENRAKISGKLVLSSFTKKTLKRFNIV